MTSALCHLAPAHLTKLDLTKVIGLVNVKSRLVIFSCSFGKKPAFSVFMLVDTYFFFLLDHFFFLKGLSFLFFSLSCFHILFPPMTLLHLSPQV